MPKLNDPTLNNAFILRVYYLTLSTLHKPILFDNSITLSTKVKNTAGNGSDNGNGNGYITGEGIGSGYGMGSGYGNGYGED